MSASEPKDAQEGGDRKVAVVKKYANRRLYNTATSRYVTLDELSRMIRDGQDFVVVDARTGEDITRSVLTQIILEEDSKGRNLLPTAFLRQLISFYDDSLHALLPKYLELSMENFARHQDQLRAYMERTFGALFPVGRFEELVRQNVALFQQAAAMFSPFSQLGGNDRGAAERQPQGGDPREEEARRLSEEVRALRAQLELLQRQIERLSRSAGGAERSPSDPDRPARG